MTLARAAVDFGPLRDEIQVRMQAGMPAAIERLGWNAETIARHQRDELRALVAHATAHSPFHRRRLAGVAADRLELEDLSSLPVMTKSEMMDELADVLTDPALSLAGIEAALAATTTAPVPIAGRAFALASGGSSGRRGVFCFDRDAAVAYFSALSRHSMARLQALGDLVPADGITTAIVSAPSAVHATGTAPAATAGSRIPITFVSVPVTLPLDAMVEQLNALSAPLLYGYPSMLARLADEQRAGRLHLNLLGVTSTSETLLPELRQRIHAGFGAPIVDTFGSTEGLIGVSAPDDDVLVFNTDQCIVELVDEAHRPVPVGAPSAKILVTNLTNRLQPLIRYEINDRFVRQPPDGTHGHLRARVEGRDDDELRYGAVTLHPVVVRGVMVKTPAVADYQVRQTERGIDLHAVPQSAVDVEALERRLARALTEAGLEHAEVSVRLVDRLERDDRTGKIRRFRPLLRRS
jgi:phenylacetate-coenzyme A ligase PaaK-like adenylate-forming protein